jgi:hypothetical protein
LYRQELIVQNDQSGPGRSAVDRSRQPRSFEPSRAVKPCPSVTFHDRACLRTRPAPSLPAGTRDVHERWSRPVLGAHGARALDLVHVSAGQSVAYRKKWIDRVFEKGPPAGFEPAHTAPEWTPACRPELRKRIYSWSLGGKWGTGRFRVVRRGGPGHHGSWPEGRVVPGGSIRGAY